MRLASAMYEALALADEASPLRALSEARRAVELARLKLPEGPE